MTNPETPLEIARRWQETVEADRHGLSGDPVTGDAAVDLYERSPGALELGPLRGEVECHECTAE